MTLSLSSRWLVLLSLALVPIGYRAGTWLLAPSAAFEFDAAMVEPGRELFLHEWTAGDPLAGEGDGLGPVFNASSCVACHRQKRPGGGGPVKNNVTTFTVRSAAAEGPSRHGVVHASATDDAFRETLASVAPGLPAASQPDLSDLLPSTVQGCFIPPSIRAPAGVDISQRNTPALFGASLIDAISDRVIIANERKQRLKWGLAGPETEEFAVGRALRLADGRVGKFGWKAQIATLPAFVRAACANELGLGNSSHAQPASLSKKDYRPPGLDLTDEQCDQITAFVASLPRPVEALPSEPQSRDRAAAGKQLFESIGCADCHTPCLGDVEGIYSDLLLHRMGETLVGGGSYGDPPPKLPELVSGEGPHSSEWRTPPLWGVADSAPYLHDGRAATLKEAIELHDGQAEKSARRFEKLPTSQQDDLMAFLRTLKAPQEAESP